MNKKILYYYISHRVEVESVKRDDVHFLPVFKQILSQKIEYYYFEDPLNPDLIAVITGSTLPESIKDTLVSIIMSQSTNAPITHTLIAWFDRWHRIMPWRTLPSIYGTWVSEVMLQQTQVVTVINYYNRFMTRFPTIFELAAANEDEVLLYWKGLGYYSRARNLHACAKTVVENYGGIFPQNKKALLSLPGIGDYTSGAILSIGYNLREHAIDGNVTRIISRLYAYSENSKSKEAFSFFKEKLDTLLMCDYSKFNQALMDLGAMICKGKKPNCTLCPLEPFCQASELSLTETIPLVPKKADKSIENYSALLYQKKECYFLEYRNTTTLLKNTYGAILSERPPSDYSRMLKPIKHIFTHKIWTITPYIIEYNGQPLPKGEFFSQQEFQNLAIAKAFQKITDQL